MRVDDALQPREGIGSGWRAAADRGHPPVAVTLAIGSFHQQEFAARLPDRISRVHEIREYLPGRAAAGWNDIDTTFHGQGSALAFAGYGVVGDPLSVRGKPGAHTALDQ